MFSLEKYKMEGKKFYMQYMFDFLYSYIIRGVFLGNPLVDDSRRGRRWMALAALALSLVVAAGNGLQNYADYGAQYTGLLDPHFPGSCGHQLSLILGFDLCCAVSALLVP